MLDRVREALFSTLVPRLPGAHVLDLFAGSGSLGIEALSRGVERARLVERDPRTVGVLERNVAQLGLAERVEVVQADALAPLQGRWVVTAGEHNGESMDSLNGGVMAIDGAAFEITTVSGNVLTGTLEVDASMRPTHLDLLHASGTRWEAVFEVDGTLFRLNYVDASGVDPRPTGFTTLPTNEESLIVLNREGR